MWWSSRSIFRIADDINLSGEWYGGKFRSDEVLNTVGRTAARACADERKGHGVELLIDNDSHRVTHRLSNREFGRPPKQVDTRDVNNATKRQAPGGSENRPAKWNGRVACNLPKRLSAAPALDCCRNALRKKKPPRDYVAIPSVDDDLNGLVEQVAVGNVELHGVIESQLGNSSAG